jgi:flagellar biosynthesis/type III secretory pathway chaperone
MAITGEEIKKTADKIQALGEEIYRIEKERYDLICRGLKLVEEMNRLVSEEKEVLDENEKPGADLKEILKRSNVFREGIKELDEEKKDALKKADELKGRALSLSSERDSLMRNVKDFLEKAETN